MRNGDQAFLDALARKQGYTWFDYQLDCFEQVTEDDLRFKPGEANLSRYCLYYKTGAGKSITALVMLALIGEIRAVVIAPPSTHDTWVEQGAAVNIKVTAMSHAKFRDKGTKLERDVAVIADEMHLFGKNTGKGWMKLDVLARHLQAPLIMASATPNYNDAHRVYCIQHVLNPDSVKGGFLEFLYKNCQTEQDPFSQTPKVLGFLHHPDAAAYLAALPGVFYLPDDLVYQIQDIPIAEKIPQEFESFGYNRRKRKIVASQIEDKHDRIALSLLNEDGYAENDVLDRVLDVLDDAVESVLIFCAHSTVAEGLSKTLTSQRPIPVPHGLVTGDTSTKKKQLIIDEFRSGAIDVLIGTASLATGTDGLDKVCDTLLIVDDTEDDALRRQLIGRIMPRGEATSSAHKSVFRLVLQP